jgi:hypothetical protein
VDIARFYMQLIKDNIDSSSIETEEFGPGTQTYISDGTLMTSH